MNVAVCSICSAGGLCECEGGRALQANRYPMHNYVIDPVFLPGTLNSEAAYVRQSIKWTPTTKLRKISNFPDISVAIGKHKCLEEVFELLLFNWLNQNFRNIPGSYGKDPNGAAIVQGWLVLLVVQIHCIRSSQAPALKPIPYT
jgi:hypothetical protein